MKVRPTVATIATNIVMVKTDVKKGEKVLSAYIFVSIRFDCWLLGVMVGSGKRHRDSLSALLLSMLTNGARLIALWLHYRRKKERCQVFF